MRDMVPSLQDPQYLDPKYKVPAERPGRLVVKTKFIIKKWASPEDHQSGKEPYAIEVAEGNIGLNIGIQCALDTIGGFTATTWGGVVTFLGVGVNTSIESATATALLSASGPTSQLYLALDATSWPTRSAQTLTWQSTATSAQANFAWNEFTVSTNNSNLTGIKLIRKLSQQGTKISGQVWQLQIQVTMS